MKIVLDGKTGSILSLASPGTGEMLRTTPEDASILDLAYPVPQFEPLRLASRFSPGARITKTAEGVTIHWDRLGTSLRGLPDAGERFGHGHAQVGARRQVGAHGLPDREPLA